MHFTQLEYILEVAKTGSFYNAATNLHVSPATVSQSIANLEKKYRIKIFNRSRNGTVPTEVGRKVIEKAYEIRDKFIELEREIQVQTTIFDKELRIVAPPGSPLLFMPKLLKQFGESFPQIEVLIKESTSPIKAIKDNEADLGFITANENTWVKLGNVFKNDLHFETILQGRLYVITGKDSSLSYKDSVTPEELLQPYSFVRYTVIDPVYKDIIKQYGPIKAVFESSSSEIIKQAVRESNSISIVLDLNIKDDPHILNGELVAIPLVNYEKSNLTYGLVRSKKSPLSSSARIFIKTMNSIIAEDF